MTNKLLEKIVLFVTALTFFVPLLFFPRTFIFPFIVPKIVFFRSLTLILLGFYLLLLAVDWQRYRPHLTPTMIGVLAFIGSFTISTFAGADWYHSFWDNHERMLGLFTVSHYVVLFVIVASVVRGWDNWKWLLRTFLFAGGIVMVIAAIQRYGNHEFLLNRSGDRSASTLGNPIYVSGYGLFLAFLGYLLALQESHTAWRVFAGIGSILGVLGVFWGGTRGAFLGLVAGAGMLMIFYLISHRNDRRIRIAAIALAVAGMVAFSTLFFYRKTHYVQKIPVLGSLLNISLSSGTANTRIMAWGVAWNGFLDRPVFGWGPGNYFFAFNKYYRPEFLEHGWGETWFDNAHNIIMNTLAERGAIGLILYLGLFGITIMDLWRAYRRRGAIDTHIVSVGCAFLVAHLAQAVFVFENPTSYLYFFFFLAFLDSSAAGYALPREEPITSRKTLSLPLAGLVSLAVLIIIFATNVNPARANQASLIMLRRVYNREDAIKLFQEATKIPTPHIDDIRNDFVRALFTVLPDMAKEGKLDVVRYVSIFAFNEMEKNRALHPMDIRVHLQEAQLAEQVLALTGYTELVVDAEPITEEALRLSPKRQQVAYTIVGLKLPLGKADEAIEILRQSIAYDPKIAEGWWRLGYILRQVGKIEDAQKVIGDARARGIVFDERGADIANLILPIPASDTPPTSS